MRPYHPGYLPPQFPGAYGLPEGARIDRLESLARLWRRRIGRGRRAFDQFGLQGPSICSRCGTIQTERTRFALRPRFRSDARKTSRNAKSFISNCRHTGSIPAAQIHWCNAWYSEIQRQGVLAPPGKSRWTKTQGGRAVGRRIPSYCSWAPRAMRLPNFHNSICKLLPEKNFPDAGGPPKKLLAFRQSRARVG